MENDNKDTGIDKDSAFILSLYVLYLMDKNDFDMHLKANRPRNIRDAIINKDIDRIIKQIKVMDVEDLFDDNDTLADMLKKVHISRYSDVDHFIRELRHSDSLFRDEDGNSNVPTEDMLKEAMEQYVEHDNDLGVTGTDDPNITKLVLEYIKKNQDQFNHHMVLNTILIPLLNDKKYDEIHKLFTFYIYDPAYIKMNYHDGTNLDDKTKKLLDIIDMFYANRYIIKYLTSDEGYIDVALEEMDKVLDEDDIIPFVNSVLYSQAMKILHTVTDGLNVKESGFNPGQFEHNLASIRANKYYCLKNIKEWKSLHTYNYDHINFPLIINNFKHKFTISFEDIQEYRKTNIAYYSVGFNDIIYASSRKALQAVYDKTDMAKLMQVKGSLQYYIKNLYDIVYELKDVLASKENYGKYKKYLTGLQLIKEQVQNFEPVKK